jgi:hypothetical protein
MKPGLASGGSVPRSQSATARLFLRALITKRKLLLLRAFYIVGPVLSNMKIELSIHAVKLPNVAGALKGVRYASTTNGRL